MGEAKQRGTFEERKAAAVARRAEVRAAQGAVLQRRGKRVSPQALASIAAMAAMASIPNNQARRREEY